MLTNEQRNRKISQLIESAIHDFCKILGCNYYSNNEAIMLQLEGKDLFYIYPEFDKDDYKININCIVFSDLTIS